MFKPLFRSVELKEPLCFANGTLVMTGSWLNDPKSTQNSWKNELSQTPHRSCECSEPAQHFDLVLPATSEAGNFKNCDLILLVGEHSIIYHHFLANMNVNRTKIKKEKNKQTKLYSITSISITSVYNIFNNIHQCIQNPNLIALRSTVPCLVVLDHCLVKPILQDLKCDRDSTR